MKAKRSITSLDRLKSLARVIYEDYILEGSPQEINIKGETRERVAANAVKIIDKNAGWECMFPHVFEPAKKEVEFMMRKDTFFRLKRSSAYQTLKDKELSGEVRAGKLIYILTELYPQIKEMTVEDMLKLPFQSENKSEAALKTTLKFMESFLEFAEIILNNTPTQDLTLSPDALLPQSIGRSQAEEQSSNPRPKGDNDETRDSLVESDRQGEDGVEVSLSVPTNRNTSGSNVATLIASLRTSLSNLQTERSSEDIQRSPT